MRREIIEQLITKAKEAKEKAYAPYSKFHVGAALLTKDGELFVGCNIENASFSATNCAERTAIFKGVSEGKTEFEAIAVVADKAMTPPCGVCLQVMAEFCNSTEFEVILAKDEKDYKIYTLQELMPISFNLQKNTRKSNIENLLK